VTEPATAQVVAFHPRRGTAAAVLAALRPRQWPKNLLLFAGILFAAKLGEAAKWVEAVSIFIAYCAASSAAYMVNDLRDVEHDRAHPVKRDRPIARGELPQDRALVLAGVLAGLAVAIASVLGFTSLLFLLGFVALQLAYSLGLKRLVLVDVAVIAGLFVVRAAAGAAAVHVSISVWLLVCTALLAFFLGLAKRRGELVLVGAEETPGRPVLERYSLRLVDRLLAVTVAATIAAYTVYTVTAHTVWMALTVPFVVFGLARYLVLVHRHELGEEPENVLLSDPPVLACIALWSVTSALILGLT
jgi:4-hydroxybenzoate polyprenyltransferase